MPRSLGVFISSKMVELSEERRTLEALLPTLGDDTQQLFPWVFETDAPASGSSIRSVYMNALDQSELYIGLFWNDYGEWTIDEFHRAGELGITRHLYVKNTPSDSHQRDPRLQAFLDQQSDVRFGITPRWFTDSDDLARQVTRSVSQWLIERQIAHHSATTAVIARSSDDVPEVPRGLIGREDLIAEVHTLLDDGTRLLLRGFGGMGKTALAATIAAERIDAGKGPVVWVKAGAADVNAIFEALGRAFDEQQAIASAQGDERLQIIRHLLAEHKPLLVLDDVWNGSALALVVKALPRTMPLLVTSRQRYPLDETIEVAELKPDAALKLLNYHVRRRDLSADPAAPHLCEVLGYHAFALEIAGKTLKVYDLSAGELLSRIQAAPHDLNMPGDFGELGRKGIKSLLDASVDALDKRLHDVFVTFGGLFEPTSTPQLLALTMSAETDDIRDALEQIELRGLVNSAAREDIGYYRLHDLAYSYARTMFVSKGLSEAPVIEACRRYTAVYFDNLTALDVEQSNILEAASAAHETMLRTGSGAGSDVLVDIMRLLTVDGPYFAARGHTSHSLELLRTAIDAATQQGEIETAHFLWSKLGNTYADFTGDLDAALDAYQKALTLARELENTQREAVLLTVIGKIRFRQNAADSDSYYEQAEVIAREHSQRHDDDFALCFVLHHRGYMEGVRGEAEKSTARLEQSRALSGEAASIAARLGLTELHFHSLINRGAAEHELKDYHTALATHESAYLLAREQGNYPWMASALQSMGEDEHCLGQPEQAQRHLDEALALWRQSGGKAQMTELTGFMQRHDYTIKPE